MRYLLLFALLITPLWGQSMVEIPSGDPYGAPRPQALGSTMDSTSITMDGTNVEFGQAFVLEKACRIKKVGVYFTGVTSSQSMDLAIEDHDTSGTGQSLGDGTANDTATAATPTGAGLTTWTFPATPPENAAGFGGVLVWTWTGTTGDADIERTNWAIREAGDVTYSWLGTTSSNVVIDGFIQCDDDNDGTEDRTISWHPAGWSYVGKADQTEVTWSTSSPDEFGNRFTTPAANVRVGEICFNGYTAVGATTPSVEIETYSGGTSQCTGSCIDYEPEAVTSPSSSGHTCWPVNQDIDLDANTEYVLTLRVEDASNSFVLYYQDLTTSGLHGVGMGGTDTTGSTDSVFVQRTDQGAWTADASTCIDSLACNQILWPAYVVYSHVESGGGTGGSNRAYSQ